MSEQAQAEKKTVTGVCEEIIEKNGWTAFAVNVGSQYPVKLSTKLPAIIEAARAVGGELATWTFKESQGNENPNKPGEHFRNRYLESVETGGTATAPAGGSAPAPQQRPADSAHGPVSLGDKDRLISRQVCLKAAAARHSGMTGEQDPALRIMEDAARFERWLYRDIDPVPLGSGTETPPSAPPVTPVDPDDDIPF